MRAAPIGVFASIDEVVEKCTIQSRITHDTPDGIHAAVATSLLAHYCIYSLGPKADVAAFLEQYVLGSWSAPWRGEVRSKGRMSVRAAITALIRSDHMSGLLQSCVTFSGDVDAVAAISMAAGAHSEEITQDLPGHLVKKLENGPYGREYLAALDKRLMSLVSTRSR